MEWRSPLNCLGICLLFTASLLMAAPTETNAPNESNVEIETDTETASPISKEVTDGSPASQNENDSKSSISATGETPLRCQH